MENHSTSFNEHEVLHKLKHYLPAQAPLKDFIHHNTLHAFQHLPFHHALRKAAKLFGYKTSLSIEEFRELYKNGKIDEAAIHKTLSALYTPEEATRWKNRMLSKKYDISQGHRVGLLRANWKNVYNIDLDIYTQPELFRLVCSYLDQGIAIWNFPAFNKGFLSSLRELEKNTFNGFFKSARARRLLLETDCTLSDLLKIVVGEESLYERYLYDQQFAHQGWSGLVSVIEDHPETLMAERKICLRDFIAFELLLEIDTLDDKFDEIWSPLAYKVEAPKEALFAPVEETETSKVIELWQESYECTYYDEVLDGLLKGIRPTPPQGSKNFQALFCIDDRECSIRRHIEFLDPSAETFGTPGFFGVEFYFQPEFGKSYSKLCPAPVTPRYLIKELDTKEKRKKDVFLAKLTHNVFQGWLISQTVGFWSAFRLFLNVFRPTNTPASASSFKHMDRFSKLTITCTDPSHQENGLQLGFTVDEMVSRVEALLKSIGLTKDFAPLVYVIGHGSSSVNNPHYAAYDCGACSGRPGSVNARVLSYMANQSEVRKKLAEKGLLVPEATQFVGGLHDTTRDEIEFFDEHLLTEHNKALHKKNFVLINQALDLNAKERSRRLVSIRSNQAAKKIHQQIRIRSVSLFEPRPELNHATNALCIVGRRELSKHVFLDRRSFLNSYDYRLDPSGDILSSIMKPLGPVCGGINLEYFFSRVDNHKLGAGTKLPHNVMGLFGVANGIDGDLRPGLPSQMIEVHDPVRLLIIVEHHPEVVLKAIQSVDAMYEWFINEWVRLAVIDPETRGVYTFRHGAFTAYEPLSHELSEVHDIVAVLEKEENNLPVYLLS